MKEYEVDEQRNLMTKIYDQAMNTSLKSGYLESLIAPMKEKHDQGI